MRGCGESERGSAVGEDGVGVEADESSVPLLHLKYFLLNDVTINAVSYVYFDILAVRV